MKAKIENLIIDSDHTAENDRLFVSPEIAIHRRLAFTEQERLALNRPYLVPQWRCIHVLSGSAVYMANLHTVAVAAGDTIAFPQNSVIELLQVSPNYSLTGISTCKVPTADMLHVPGGCFTNEIRTLLEMLWQAVHHHPFPGEYVERLVDALHALLQTAATPEGFDTWPATRRPTRLVHNFIELLASDATVHRRISHYAEALHITPHYLSAVVKAETGHSAADWIDRAVIQAAKLRLHYADCSVAEVADALNFANPAFFNKYFKRLTGMTPLAYKRFCRTDGAAE